MHCPRCQQPTHVIATRTKGVAVRRQRGCGLRKSGELVSPSCGFEFWTIEVPVGFTALVAIRMGPKGLETKLVNKEVT